jgi:hypothetical protein
LNQFPSVSKKLSRASHEQINNGQTRIVKKPEVRSGTFVFYDFSNIYFWIIENEWDDPFRYSA